MAIKSGSGHRLRRQCAVFAAALAVATTGVLGPTGPAIASTTLLRFFWNADGSSTWHVETISSLCLGTPAMTRTTAGTGTLVTCRGPGNTLWLWANIDGSTSWSAHQVAGSGSAFSDPAIVTWSTGTAIAAVGPNNSLWDWSTSNGSPWQATQVSGAGTAYSAPAMALPVLGTYIAAYGPNGSLWLHIGFLGWSAEQVAGPGTCDTADGLGVAMTLSGSGTELACGENENIAPGVWFFWAASGSTIWNSALVAQPGFDFIYATKAMARYSQGTDIASLGGDGELFFSWNQDGSPIWSTNDVMNEVAMACTPAIARTSDSTEIADTDALGGLALLSNTDGTPPWPSDQIVADGTVANPGPIVGCPAMVRSSTGTEIAVVSEP